MQNCLMNLSLLVKRPNLEVATKYDSKKAELGSSDQEASLSPGKNAGIVLVLCLAWKCVPTAISRGVDISEVPGCHLLRQMSSQ